LKRPDISAENGGGVAMWKRVFTTGFCLLVAVLLARVAEALPPGFTNTPIGGTWDEANALAFSADGTRLYVVERGGKVWIVENGVKLATPLLDISDEVGAWRDFGLLGFALHPNFDQNGYVYAFFVVDRYYLFNHGKPGYDPGQLESQQFQATIGRLSRFTADPATNRKTIIPGSEVVLIGETPSDGIPETFQSHGTGQVVFAEDGTLLVSAGDGSDYGQADNGSDPDTYYAQALSDGILKSWENVGAWRAQEVDSLSGKILRIDPFTGNGIPSNPYYDPANPRSARSRVFALGLRNPYRFTIRPESGSHDPADGNPGTLYIGDVGWNSAESMHILHQAGQNFGWPAFEGLFQQALNTTSAYWTANTQNPLAKNPLGSQPGCNIPFLRFRDLIVQATLNPPSWPNPCNAAVQIPDTWTDPSTGTVYTYHKYMHSAPPISWRYDAWVATYDGSGNLDYTTMGTAQCPVDGSDFAGNTSTAGIWYTGTDFPPEWQNTYFHADFGTGWIKSFGFDANDQLLDVVDFLEPNNFVTFVTTNPVTGGIYYVNYGDTVGEIRWVGTGNTPPTAVAAPPVSWNTGSQLAVQFTGSNSYDPDPGAILSYVWNFGDGSPQSTQANPQHTFSTAGSVPVTFTPTLTVTDEDGHSDSAQVLVSIRNSPPSVALTSPSDGGFYSMAGDSTVQVRSSISDGQSAASSLTCSLLVELVHNNHTHPEPPISACNADVTITPAGCDGNTYHWRFTLTVTDPQGLSSNASASLSPDCSTVPNQPPYAASDTIAVVRGSSVPISVLSNDSDPDGSIDSTSVHIVTYPTAGSVQVNPTTGVVTYTHGGGAGTSDSFTYTVSDNVGAPSNAATVSVTVLSSSGLVAAYGFEDSGSTLSDLSGRGNNGTLNGATWTTSGHSGKALSFNGTNARVDIPGSSSLNLTSGMTLEAWVYPTTAGANNWHDVIYKGSNDIYYLMSSSDGASAPAAGGTFGAGGGNVYAPSALPLNTWSHIAATYDGTTLRFYVNGTEVANRVESGSIQTSAGPLTLGGDPLYGQYFGGRIDDVRVYNRALFASEIQNDKSTPLPEPGGGVSLIAGAALLTALYGRGRKPTAAC
jgi:glucose/arabinose dehydrogenase